MSNNLKLLEVKTEDHAPQKWSVLLKEDVFKRLLIQGNHTTVHKIFGDGSLFSPLLFGKFFDPSDAFPLWEFDSEILLANLHSGVDWIQNDHEYVLKAEIPGTWDNNVQIHVDKGKVLEISGQWKQPHHQKVKDWRCGNWWEHGYVRRLEIPQDGDWRHIEAKLISSDNMCIEVKIPKSSDSVNQAKNGSGTDSN